MTQPTGFRSFAIWSTANRRRFLWLWGVGIGVLLAVLATIDISGDQRAVDRPYLFVLVPALCLLAGYLLGWVMWFYFRFLNSLATRRKITTRPSRKS
ncbi:MAG: hypothetical protein ABI439_04925 [Rhodospirillales bacterium]